MVWRMIYPLVGLLLLSFMACNHNSNELVNDGDTQFANNGQVEVKYAKGFQFDTIEEGIQVLRVMDPGTGKWEQFALVPKSVNANIDFEGSVITTPVSDLAIFSSSFVGFLNELNALNRLAYIENIHYIYSDEVHDLFQKEEISETGAVGQLNVEKLILHPPGLILLNDALSDEHELKKLSVAGVEILPIIEWQESDPLARAEWIKVFGALLDKEILADSIFQTIESDYLGLKEVIVDQGNQPNVLFSAQYQGVWYIPGGNSYVAHILKDAGGVYPWQDDQNTGSLSLSYEEVLLQSEKYDLWINPDASSLSELQGRDNRYQVLINQMELGVFQSINRVKKEGGNDYWESGVVRPDLVLKDFCKMLHPEVYKGQEFIYFKKLY